MNTNFFFPFSICTDKRKRNAYSECIFRRTRSLYPSFICIYVFCFVPGVALRQTIKKKKLTKSNEWNITKKTKKSGNISTGPRPIGWKCTILFFRRGTRVGFTCDTCTVFPCRPVNDFTRLEVLVPIFKSGTSFPIEIRRAGKVTVFFDFSL